MKDFLIISLLQLNTFTNWDFFDGEEGKHFAT
jgi:hypothetical protein